MNRSVFRAFRARFLLLSVVAFGGLPWINPVAAQGSLTEQQRQIIRRATYVEGWFTEKDHRNFWEPLLVKIRREEDMAVFRRMLQTAFSHALNYQLETWKSIELSQRSAQVTKTLGYDEAKQALISIPTRGRNFDHVIDESERMLVAAANKTVYISKGGPIYLNEETVEKVLSGLEGSFCRIRRLIDPTWSNTKTEYTYAAARLKILAECPWRIDYEEVTIEGKKTKSVSLSHAVGENENVAIGFALLPGRWTDPARSMTRIARDSLEAVGVSGVRPIVVDWRGRKTATAQGSVKTSEGTMNATIRVVEGVKAQGFWSMIAASTQSMPDAVNLLATVEESVMLD